MEDSVTVKDVSSDILAIQWAISVGDFVIVKLWPRWLDCDFRLPAHLKSRRLRREHFDHSSSDLDTVILQA